MQNKVDITLSNENNPEWHLKIRVTSKTIYFRIRNKCINDVEAIAGKNFTVKKLYFQKGSNSGENSEIFTRYCS